MMCCVPSDCQNDGQINSLAQSPGFRFRRQAHFSHKEDRDHARMQQHAYTTTTTRHRTDKPHRDSPAVSGHNYTHHHHTPANHLTNEVLSFEDRWRHYSLNDSATLVLLEERLECYCAWIIYIIHRLLHCSSMSLIFVLLSSLISCISISCHPNI